MLTSALNEALFDRIGKRDMGVLLISLLAKEKTRPVAEYRSRSHCTNPSERDLRKWSTIICSRPNLESIFLA